MLVREPLDQEKSAFDQVAVHPLQSWSWGDFRKSTGVDVLRLAVFEGKHITNSFQITIHSVPKLGWKIGYLPRSSMPDDAQLFALKTAAEKYNLIYIKNEPNIYSPTSQASQQVLSARDFLLANQHQLGRPMFTKYSFVIDLTKSEDELAANLKPKTRYNIQLAQKKGVQISLDNSSETFQAYLNLLEQTTQRQAFYSHTKNYHTQMYDHMSKAGIARMLKATYQGEILSVWIVFVFNNTIYYPYGASSRKNKELMANNLLAWEVIKYGISQGCSKFDMWGSLGPKPDEQDPWFGFHRFKSGYGGDLVEFVGTYDYIADPQKYLIFTKLDELRWKYLKFRAKLPF